MKDFINSRIQLGDEGSNEVQEQKENNETDKSLTKQLERSISYKN